MLTRILETRRELRRQIDPQSLDPERVVLAASESTARNQLPLPHLYSHGFRRVRLLTRSPKSILATSTLGAFELEPTCCGVDLVLDPDAAPSAFRSYDDLVIAARRARDAGTQLRVAP